MKEAYYFWSFQTLEWFIFFFNLLPKTFNLWAHFDDIFFRIHMVLLIFFLGKTVEKEDMIWIWKGQHHVLYHYSQVISTWINSPSSQKIVFSNEKWEIRCLSRRAAVKNKIRWTWENAQEVTDANVDFLLFYFQTP